MVREENGNGVDWRKFARGMLVFLMALVPIAALLWAVLSTEPEAVCGSWWYGVLLPLLIAGVHGRRTP